MLGAAGFKVGSEMGSNVGYGGPKYTATRNNRLLARNDTTNNLLFRVAVYFGTPYARCKERVTISEVVRE